MYSLNKVGMKSIVIAGNFKSQNYYKLLLEAVPELENSELGQIKSAKAPNLTSVISMEAQAPGKSVLF